MKAKSKPQLHDELYALQRENDFLKSELAFKKTDHDHTRKLLSDYLVALKFALSYMLDLHPESYEAAAKFLFAFAAKFKEISDFDLSKGKAQLLDWLADDTELDQVTVHSVKENFPLFADVIGLINEGKSELEIEEFIRREKMKKRKK